MRRLWVLLVLWCSGTLLGAQDIGSSTLSTPRNPVGLYAGPGITFERTGNLIPGQLVNILERNALGNWLHIWQVLPDGSTPINGWVLTSAMQLRTDLDLFADVSENTWILDGDPLRVTNRAEAPLYALPIMPRISDAMQAVYAQGIANGANPAMITRVGDSLLNSEWYLLPMRQTDYKLGSYAYLEPDLKFFGPNMHWSVAVQKGLSTYGVFDPLWASNNCQPNESPLQCEYRIAKPIAALIMFGPNDVKNGMPEDYRDNLTRLITDSIAAGVIPVLMTFSSHPALPTYARTLEFNTIITELAVEYDVPLINVWLAMRTLPEYGLEQDLTHLKNGGYTFINFEGDNVERSGITLLNLLSLMFMQNLRTTLAIPGVEPTATLTPRATATVLISPTPSPTPTVVPTLTLEPTATLAPRYITATFTPTGTAVPTIEAVGFQTSTPLPTPAP